MSSMPWQLDKHHARLALGEVTGKVDLLSPNQGLQLRWHDDVLAALAVGLPSITDSQAASVLDAWVRGGDLVATYAERDDHRTRGQVYWRAHQYEQGGRIFPAVDLIASVQTSLLDSDPTLNVRSSIPAREVLRLTAVESSMELAECNVTGPLRISAPTEIACLMFRLADGLSSYVEMVHPADFNESVLQSLSDGRTELFHRLFHGRLEKGVILRSRVRALFVPTDNDAALASGCYADFAASEPHLTV